VENSTKNPSRNTELFSSLPASVAVLIFDVIHAVYIKLAWRQASKSLLAEILSRLGETESFELSHEEFCATLWPYLDKKRSREKISRWVAKLRIDMELSRFNAVFIPKQKVLRVEGGGFKGRPTVYKIGHFWKLFRYVQDSALDIDLLSLSLPSRRAHVRVFVNEWLNEQGAEKIDRSKIEEKVKPPNPSLPCRCACASCQTCAAKSATGSEAEKRPAQERITKSGVALRMGNALEELFECGAQWANLELDMKEYWVKVTTEINVLDQRLAGAVKRHNAPKVKMNGGQPK